MHSTTETISEVTSRESCRGTADEEVLGRRIQPSVANARLWPRYQSMEVSVGWSAESRTSYAEWQFPRISLPSSVNR